MTEREKTELAYIRRSVSFFRFAVEGRNDFPVDMLRYDCCWPFGEISAFRILDMLHQRRIEMLGIKTPNEGRWNSFGWKVCAPKFPSLGTSR